MAVLSKILFVDDDPRALEALKAMVALIPERWQCHFVTAGDAALALLDDAAAAGEPFDAIVSDLDMPGTDGLICSVPHVTPMPRSSA
jgi:two-component system chemotaxis response regulator CheV